MISTLSEQDKQDYTKLLKELQKQREQQKKENNLGNKSNMQSKSNSKSNSKSSGIVVSKKGECGYIPTMDLDGDGSVTMEEFDKYCEENGVSSKDKIKMLEMIAAAKLTEKEKEEASSKNVNKQLKNAKIKNNTQEWAKALEAYKEKEPEINITIDEI